MSTLAWQKARRVLGLSVYARALPDWPDAFTPGELSALQYPREGTDPEKRKARQNQYAMMDSIKTAVTAGSLASVTRSVQMTKTEYVPDYSAERRAGSACLDSASVVFQCLARKDEAKKDQRDSGSAGDSLPRFCYLACRSEGAAKRAYKGMV